MRDEGSQEWGVLVLLLVETIQDFLDRPWLNGDAPALQLVLQMSEQLALPIHGAGRLDQRGALVRM